MPKKEPLIPNTLEMNVIDTLDTSLIKTSASYRTPTWYIKTLIISILLFVQTYLLGTLIENYIHRADYFNLITNNYLFMYAGLTLLGIFLTYSLSVGGWNKLEQYVYIPASIGAGMGLILIKYNIYNGITITLILSLLIAYAVYKTTMLKKLLIKFEPHFVLDTSLRGLIIVFSIFAIAILMLSQSTREFSKINVGEKMVEVAREPLKSFSEFNVLNKNVEGVLENQINNMLVPYKSFFKPIMAIFVYFLISFIGTISFWMYSFLVGPIFKLAKAVKFINIEKEIVEQEVPRF